MCSKKPNSLVEIQQHFSDETVCLKHLEEQRWNGKVKCPYCACEKVYACKDNKTYKCSNKACKKKFNALTGTMFENSNIPLTKWFIAIYLLSSHKKGISSCQLAKDIGVTQKTAWFMNHRIRQMMKEKEALKLKGTVEVDETYVGGKEKNKHKNERKGKTQGRSTENKMPVLGMIERRGNIVVIPVEDVKAKSLIPLIQKHIKEKSRVITDSLRSYSGVSGKYNHKTVNHNEDEWVRGDIHTNTIEGFWGLFKRGLVGIYHQMSKKHLGRYCNEFAFRFNTRKMKTEGDRFNLVLSKCSNTRLKYKQLISNFKAA